MTTKETVTVHYVTRQRTHAKGSSISASGRCPKCSQDYSSSVPQFKRWMRAHLSNSHMAKPRWRSTKG